MALAPKYPHDLMLKHRIQDKVDFQSLKVYGSDASTTFTYSG
jgi:hypothetical protein